MLQHAQYCIAPQRVEVAATVVVDLLKSATYNNNKSIVTRRNTYSKETSRFDKTRNTAGATGAGEQIRPRWTQRLLVLYYLKTWG